MTNLPPLGQDPAQPEAPVSPAASAMPAMPQVVPLKERSVATVAAIHWVLGYFLIPLVGGFLGNFILVPIAFILSFGISVVQLVFLSAMGIAFAWLGATISGRYVADHYVVADPSRVALIATGYGFVLGAFFRLASVLQNGFNSTAFTIDVIAMVATLLVFYFVGRENLRRAA